MQFLELSSLGENRFEVLDSLGFGDALDSSDFAGQAFQGRLVDLAFRVRLLGVVFRTAQITQDFCDLDRVTRVDLRFVFLRAAGPRCV